ncbi:hypothetical protein GCK72_022404 [Caenorhabditis remanei]|uniref:Uncharacterized protein n=1 Tax=Caenorhabditis remanei TaxID=31234 RepID=A0A6A5FTX5_CAERE|nr:hypothetical protein GCK72_022404 [Caenorhabditis remanei]KAF1745956.1 hypothetical protein GCK72_022404 [Caenorhabditis remanei]
MLKMYSTAENSAEKKALKSKIHSMAGELPIEPEMVSFSKYFVRNLNISVHGSRCVGKIKVESYSASSFATAEHIEEAPTPAVDDPPKTDRPKKRPTTQDVASTLPPNKQGMVTKAYEASEDR